MKKVFLLIVLCITVASTSFAQKVKLEEGDISILKGQTSLNIQFTYDDMTVGEMSEIEYVKKKREEKNKKENGSGDKWVEEWIGNRTKRFQPKFIELFDNQKTPFKLTENDESVPYTLIFHTVFTEPGFNVGIVRSNANINAFIYVVETQNPENKLAVISIKKAPGRDIMGFDFDAAYRIAESYATSGKSFGKFLKKHKALK